MSETSGPVVDSMAVFLATVGSSDVSVNLPEYNCSDAKSS
jgi:hypothetical protein